MVLDDIADLWGVPGRFLGGASACPGTAGCQNESGEDGSATGGVLVNLELVRGVSRDQETAGSRYRGIAGSRDRGNEISRNRGTAGTRDRGNRGGVPLTSRE